MNKITFPLNPAMTSAEVRDLIDALSALIERNVLRDGNTDNSALLTALKSERTAGQYGAGTSAAVTLFQKQRGITPPTGHVDELTANALNGLLRELGLLDQPATGQDYIVSGQVTRTDGLPMAGVIVRAFHETNEITLQLNHDVADAEGRYIIRYDVPNGLASVNLRIKVVTGGGRPLTQSDLLPNAFPLMGVDLIVPLEKSRIEGTIVLEHGLPAEKLKLRLYRRGFGGKAIVLGETITIAGGHYALSYDAGAPVASLEVRAVKDDGSEVSLSNPLNDLTDSHAILNLVAPGSLQPLAAAEYGRLSADLKPHVDDMKNLAGAKENAGQRDLTVLNRATGWDARLIALASLAERLAADPDVGLPSDALYGLLRAGLPSDKLLLAQVGSDVVAMALRKVRDADIVDLDDAGIDEIQTKFDAFTNKTTLAMRVPGSRATYGELLRASGLPQEAQDKFAQIYLKHRGSSAQLWEEARNAGIDGAQIGKLQLQGKLAFLAGNSVAMTERLMKGGLKDPVELVARDFYGAEAWKNEVFEQAGIPSERRDDLTKDDRKKLAAVIPEAYVAGMVEGRLEAYAEDMARKVRLSYPTRVLGRLMKTDAKFKLSAGHDVTVKLLESATAQGFRLGETPVSAFLTSNASVQGDLSDVEFRTAAQKLKDLQRVYQITPLNEAMPVLMDLGMTSAFDVTAYPEERFIALFNTKYLEIHKKSAPTGVAELVSRKAKQVNSITYNLFTIAKKLDSEPTVWGISGTAEQRAEAIARLKEALKNYPTMESLFGSLDFCECEHCRAVLSPAAYLVDLLQFVDTEPDVWGNFLEQWKATHSLQDYPHKNAAGEALKPYDVLIERRPDLPYIALTCENTHTTLPYIDIVNEILEYYVANGKLEKEAAHDTGDATTPELLAEPQNVVREAYDRLHQARYPLNLPFDLWTETVRQFCLYFETPMHRVLEVFRAQDDLFAPAQIFDRAAVFMESLGFSPAEVAIFIDPAPLAKWHELYGFANAADATTEATDAITGQRIDLNSAKALSRRLGVTYQEIADMVQTGFVNPELDKLGLLYKLNVHIRDAKLYEDEKVFFEANKDLLGKDRGTLPPTDQQRYDDLAKKRPSREITGWQVINEVAAFEQRLTDLAGTFEPPLNVSELRDAIQAIPFNRVLVLADPDAGCNFDLTTLQYADGTKADPIIFLRMNLFVRLWRKLGWSIEEIDRALTTFIPQSAPLDGTAANFEKQPLKTALIYLAHLNALDEQLKVGKQSRLKLLTLWSNIPTTGKMPLYAQLFLNRSVLKRAPVFDHPLGQYLTDPTIKLKAHVLALQGALGLTADEIGRILADAGKSLNTAELSLANVSMLYRYGLLAKALTLSVGELITLKQLCGFDPFKALYPDPLATLDQDHPFCQTLEFVKVAEEVKDTGLKIEDLDYLLRHRFDPTGKYGPDRDGTLTLLQSLFEGVRAVRTEHAVPVDPGALSEEMLRQKLGLALLPDVVERFLGMVNGTVEFTASKSGAEPHGQLPETFGGEAAILSLAYDVANKKQTLTYRGVLFDKDRFALQQRLDPSLTRSQRAVLEKLLIGVQAQAQATVADDFDADVSDVAPHAALPSAAFEREAAIRGVPYDSVNRAQTLKYHGVLSDLEKSALKQRISGRLSPAQATVFEQILERVQSQIRTSITTAFTTEVTSVTSGAELPPDVMTLEARIRDVPYSPTRQEQKLTMQGVLFDAAKPPMKAKFDAVLTAPQKEAFTVLLDDIQKLGRAFFDNHLKKQLLRLDGEAGFLEDADFVRLFAPLEPMKEILPTDTQAEVDDKRSENEKIQKKNQEALQERRYRIAQAFLPLLQERLIRQFIVQTMTAHTGADPVLVESLVADARLLAVDSSSLLGVVAKAGERGAGATYWFSADQSGIALSALLRSEDDSNQSATVTSPVRFLGSKAELAGYLVVPKDDDYAFSVVFAKKGDEAELRIEDPLDPLINKTADQDGEEVASTPISLKKAERYPIHLAVSGIGARQVILTVKSTTLPKESCNSCRLEGYLEAPAAGAYRFYIELDRQNAEGELRFRHLPEPVLVKGQANADHATLGDQPNEYLELKVGVVYHFSLDLKHLNGGDARLMVQGETLPKGPLSQLTLYPTVAIEAGERATTLLSKALQLVQSLGLSEREIRYLLTHAAEFDNLSLSELPTTVVGDTPSEVTAAVERFRRFRRLAAYARLKRDLAGGTDDLISIFEASLPAAASEQEKKDRLEKQVYPLIAKLMRRDEATVKASAEALINASAVPTFESEKPMWRLWEALQIIERFAVPPASLMGWTRIVNSATTGEGRFGIARDLKEAIKARFEPETWQRAAQTIFDKLRQRQRDALVSHVMHQHGFDRMEQLYEYFLIDPGMEPVVQTSRIRLAISSLQLFIQRCLLNLEPRVHPSTINSSQWEWMKRYRVWEANRKIFLFPENWLEPEFRDDKTHLFTELEGALLQGDVSSDLVEDAFLNYLRKLDELARLDICAMHIEDNADSALRVLHVFGRTYSQPRKYFYRRYVHQMWTPWEPVSAEIEGDHLAPVVWRDRLYLFWVTYLDQADPNPVTPTHPNKLIEATLWEVIDQLKSVVAKKQVNLHLHWSEYLQGEWSTRASGDVAPLISATVDASFVPSSVFIHVSKEYDPVDGTDLGVFVHLGGDINQAFYLAGRNAAPESKGGYGVKPSNPFNSATTEISNRYSGSGELKVMYGDRINTEPGKTTLSANPSILQNSLQPNDKYTILPGNLSYDAFQEPHLVMEAFGYRAGGWRVERHPRFLADLTGDGRADIVGFSNDWVWVALNNGDGTFQAPKPVVEAFGYAEGWLVEKHPRFLVDLTGDGRADIVGFYNDGVWVALNNGDGTFQTPKPVLQGVQRFGYDADAGGWRVEKHPRFLTDLTGDGRADIVGFGDAGVWVALNNGDGTFQAPKLVVQGREGFGYDAGGWRVEKHPRFLADLTGDGRADIVGFSTDGVLVALNNGDGTFQTPKLVVEEFGYGAGGWRVERHPRFLADLTGDGRADIVGFSNDWVWVALNNGDGTFQAPKPVVEEFGYSARGWRVENHPRFLADLTGDGRADIVGFSSDGVLVALNNGDGTFQTPKLVVEEFGYDAEGWHVEKHPRFLADLTGDGRADIVGFYNDGVWVTLNNGVIEHEIASLSKPMFYQDNRHTFFVEPEVTEPTIEDWQEWVTRTSPREPSWQEPNRLKEIVVIADTPRKRSIPDTGDPWRLPIAPGSRINLTSDWDWLVNPSSVMKFDNVLIGPNGKPGIIGGKGRTI